MILFIGNDYGVGVVLAMDDTMADTGDLVLVDGGSVLERIEEMGKSGCVICDGMHGLVFRARFWIQLQGEFNAWGRDGGYRAGQYGLVLLGNGV
jgi:hypothetical protein